VSEDGQLERISEDDIEEKASSASVEGIQLEEGTSLAR
jgi:hypothetical protein